MFLILKIMQLTISWSWPWVLLSHQSQQSPPVVDNIGILQTFFYCWLGTRHRKIQCRQTPVKRISDADMIPTNIRDETVQVHSSEDSGSLDPIDSSFQNIRLWKNWSCEKGKEYKSVFYLKDHYKIIFFRKTDLKEMTKH